MNDFMEIVKGICKTTTTDCRSLNKSDLARKLMDMINIPQDAEIMEIPLDWNNQVGIQFIIPNDDNYYCLYAGHWNDDTESMQLVISGKVIRSENKFDFFDPEKEVGLDYFDRMESKIIRYAMRKIGSQRVSALDGMTIEYKKNWYNIYVNRNEVTVERV